MKLEKICDGCANRDRTFELINRGYGPEVFKAGQYFEIEEDEYWYFLEVLPPLDMQGGGFSMIEFATGDLTNAFFKIDGRFYCMTIERRTPADFRAWLEALRAEIAARAVLAS